MMVAINGGHSDEGDDDPVRARSARLPTVAYDQCDRYIIDRDARDEWHARILFKIAMAIPVQVLQIPLEYHIPIPPDFIQVYHQYQYDTGKCHILL